MEQQVQVSEAVGRTADTIEKYGWRQGSYGAPVVGFCTVGAEAYQAQATTWAHDRSPVLAAIAEGLPPSEYFMPCDCARCKIILWNDTAGRTKEEVIAHLRMVEQREREREALAPAKEVKVEEVKVVITKMDESKPVIPWPASLSDLSIAQMWKQMTATSAPPEAPEPEETEPERVLVSA